MDINYDVLPITIGLAVVLFTAYFVLYYKFIYSIIDPLFSWIFTTAFASILASQVIPDVKDIFHFFGCQFALWIGFLIAYKRSNYWNKNHENLKHIYVFTDQFLLRWFTYFLLIIYVLSNIIIGYSKGFALLSNAPSEAKIANFQEGFGLFRKINWSTGTFVSTSLIFMYLLKKRKIDIIFLIIVTFLYSLDGSKSSLFQIVISIGIIIYHPAFSENQSFLKKFQRYMPILAIGVMSIFFTVLLKENDGIEEAFFAFIRRLLYSADSVLYFYTPINLAYFDKYTFWDYFPRLLNPIIGFLRLGPYQEALGNMMFDNLRPPGIATSITVGPNSPFYIEGRIFFYYWFAFPYSMLVGYLYATVRTYFFSLSRTSAFFFVYTASFCHIAYAIIIDMNLAVTQLFDLVFFVIPPFVLFSFLLNKKMTFSFKSKAYKYSTDDKSL